MLNVISGVFAIFQSRTNCFFVASSWVRDCDYTNVPTPTSS